ncbi:hypothetical protein B0H14DRAFT_2916142 [Mycena olivaceomarginata]|nr:hypothetical protein B0H14DRAFT_2916142 [Mycena olivaceomarginata]
MLCAIPIPILLRNGDTKEALASPTTRASAAAFPFSSHSKGYYTHTHTHTHPSCRTGGVDVDILAEQSPTPTPTRSIRWWHWHWHAPANLKFLSLFLFLSSLVLIWVLVRVGLGLLCGCGCGNHRACFRYAGVEGPGPTSRPWAFASRDSSSTDSEQYYCFRQVQRLGLGAQRPRPAREFSEFNPTQRGRVLLRIIRIRIRPLNSTVEFFLWMHMGPTSKFERLALTPGLEFMFEYSSSDWFFL